MGYWHWYSVTWNFNFFIYWFSVSWKMGYWHWHMLAYGNRVNEIRKAVTWKLVIETRKLSDGKRVIAQLLLTFIVVECIEHRYYIINARPVAGLTLESLVKTTIQVSHYALQPKYIHQCHNTENDGITVPQHWKWWKTSAASPKKNRFIWIQFI